MQKTSTQVFSDNQLLQEYLNGNLEALNTLIKRHKSKIFTSILVLVKNTEAAEDIFQDVFIKVIDSLHTNKYNDEGKFLPWVLRIAHNMCIDSFRKTKRSPINLIGDNSEISEMVVAPNGTIQHYLENNETNNSLRILIDSLPEDLREVLILRHYADKSFKEIAELTNCSVNTALGRMRYALQNLRKKIEQNNLQLI